MVKLSLAQTIIQYCVLLHRRGAHGQCEGRDHSGIAGVYLDFVGVLIFRSEKMNALKWLGGFIGVAGVVIVNWTKDGFGGGVSFIGEGFVIISMIASACSTGLIKKFGQFDSPVVMSGWQFMLGGAVMAVCGFAAGGRLGSENPMAYVVLLYLALLSAVAYSIWAVLLRANPFRAWRYIRSYSRFSA